MIQKISAYKSSDGIAHSTLEEAQMRELKCLVEHDRPVGDTHSEWFSRVAIQNADTIIDILTMKPNSLPKARKINGGTKQRKPKQSAQNTLPLDTTEPPRAA